MHPNIIGQTGVMNALDIMLDSAKQRQSLIPHVLLDGPPGTGKTSISNYVARRLNANIVTVLGGNITSLKQIIPQLLRLKEGDVLFIDEIHRLNKKISECLYTVLEDFKLHIPFEDQLATYDINKFVCMAATTSVGDLAAPLRNRFVTLHCTLYSVDELIEIIRGAVSADHNSGNVKYNFTVGAARVFATAARGTPRIAKSLSFWGRDVAISQKKSIIDIGVAKEALKLQEIDEDGTTKYDRLYLDFLKSQSKPVGVNTIASSISLSVDTIINVVEPFLLSKNKIIKTAKGRIHV